MGNSLLNLLNDIPGMPSPEQHAEIVKETKVVHEELSLAMASPEDGEYYIKSVTKDRYLDVSYDKKEDDTQIVGQTLNEKESPNQKWKVTRKNANGLPVIRVIRPVSDPERFLSVQAEGKPNVITHSEEAEWIAIPDFEGSFKLRLVDGNKILSAHNSSDWNLLLAEDEEKDTPQKYHQLWTFVENPYEG